MNGSKTISATENEIIIEFSSFDSWDEKYEHIIATGRRLPPFDDKNKTEENKIKGCQSNVWMVAEYREGKIYFMADSDSAIVKGLAALLIRVLSNHTADEILKAKLNFMDTIGMKQHLSPSRSNGLQYMIMRMKSYAITFLQREITHKKS